VSATFLFMPESAYGPTNNCIGIAEVLRQHGHRVVFAAEASWKGRLEKLGFEEDLVDLAPPAEEAADEVAAGKFWADFIRDTAPVFRRPTIEQLESFILPTWQALIEGARYCQDQLLAIIDRHRPDVIVEDNVCAFPALLTAGAPYVRIVSCNPLEMPDAALPPKFSGYAAADDTGWADFRAEYERVHRDTWAAYNEWITECGAPRLADLEFVHESKDLNLYVYPAGVDYERARPLGPTWHRLDSSVREVETDTDLPDWLLHGGGGREAFVVYLSLGSLGSADVDLMRRLVSVLADTPHRYVVSKGPLADEYGLADNMWGAAQVPQTKVLPLVDLAITHGGNNTMAECFHFGVPQVSLPLFWDQYDNAQRVEETGLGRRLATYDFEDDELRTAVGALLEAEPLRERLRKMAGEIRERDGVRRAAALIEKQAAAR
jgi:MGT family glycosyltransferase